MKNKKMVSLRGTKTIRETAREIGMPVSTYAMIEAGRRFPRKELQAKLAGYFGVTVDELFFATNGHETRTNHTA